MARRPSLLKQLSWRCEYLSYLLLETLLRPIPLGAICRFGSSVGTLFYWCSPRYRALVLRNLRLAYGEEHSIPELREMTRLSCQCTIANFLGAFKTTIMPTSRVANHISVSGLQSLYEVLGNGEGAVLVLGHMGNWEVLNRLLSFLPPGVAAGGVYQPLKNPYLDRHLLKKREQEGSKMFSKKDGFHGPASFVKNGGLLIILADQRTMRVGTAVRFFNRYTPLSPLPALLAKKTRSPVYSAGIATISSGCWQIHLCEIAHSPSTQEITTSIESQIRRSPQDYLWLHNRWKTHHRRPLSLGLKRKSDETSVGTVPLNVLVISNENITHALTRFENSDSYELPLRFHLLILSSVPAKDKTADGVHQTAAKTIGEITSAIREIDLSLTQPLELAILLEPSPAVQRACARHHFSQIFCNEHSHPPDQYLASLRDSSAKIYQEKA